MKGITCTSFSNTTEASSQNHDDNLKQPDVGAGVTLPQQEEQEMIKSKQKTFTCTVPGCRKPFSKKWNMQAHMRLHTGSTPFACRLGCGASYMWMSSRKGHELNRCRYAALFPAELNPSRRPSRYRRVHSQQSQQQQPLHSATAVARRIAKSTTTHGHHQRRGIVAGMREAVRADLVDLNRLNDTHQNITPIPDDIQQQQQTTTLLNRSDTADVKCDQYHDTITQAISTATTTAASFSTNDQTTTSTTTTPSYYPISIPHDDQQPFVNNTKASCNNYHTQHHSPPQQEKDYESYHYYYSKERLSLSESEKERVTSQQSFSAQTTSTHYYPKMEMEMERRTAPSIATSLGVSTVEQMEREKSEYQVVMDTPPSRNSVGSPVTPSFKMKPSVSSSSIIHDATVDATTPATATASARMSHITSTMSLPQLSPQPIIMSPIYDAIISPPRELLVPSASMTTPPTPTAAINVKYKNDLPDTHDRPSQLGESRNPAMLSSSTCTFRSTGTIDIINPLNGTSSINSDVTASDTQLDQKQTPSSLALVQGSALGVHTTEQVGGKIHCSSSNGEQEQILEAVKKEKCEDVYVFIDSLSDDVLADVSLPEHDHFSEEFLENLLLNREAG